MSETTKQPAAKSSIIVVTGGCGIIGSVLVAELCAVTDHHVVIVDRPGSGAASFAAQQRLGTGSSATGFELDLSDLEALPSLVGEIGETVGAPTGLVNAAASKGDDLGAFLAPVETYTSETWRSVMEVNVDGLFFLTRLIGEQMVKAGRGSIVNVSSVYGHLAPDQRIYEGSEYLGLPLSSPTVYSASKAAVIGLTKHLSVWWAPHGIRVNAVSPGGVFSGQNDQFVASYAARVPLGRMAEAAEVTAVIRFLLSSGASYMTGQNLCVDGGLSAW